MLLEAKVDAQVVLHGQLVGVGVVADGAVVLARLVRVLVVDQAAGVAVAAAALVADVGPRVVGVVRGACRCPRGLDCG